MMRRSLAALLSAVLLGVSAAAQPRLLDPFESISAWRAITSDGVTASLRQAPGVQGKALALEFSFQGGSGYAIAQRDLPLSLPENYQFTFFLRGETPVNNFEFKLLDSAGNVWWIKRANIEYPSGWKRMVIKRRHLTFAWGPSGGAPISRLAKLEFVVSVGSGGQGRIFVDNLTFEPLPADPQPAERPAVIVTPAGTAPRADARGTMVGEWRAGAGRRQPSLTLRYHQLREIGGLVLDWDARDYGRRYDVQLSDDGREWTTVYQVTDGNGGRDYINLPDGEGRGVRLRVLESSRGKGIRLKQMALKGAAFSSTSNAFFASIAADQRPGLYPRYFLGKQSDWTVIGVPSDDREALINEQGQIEVDKMGFSLEPFLFVEGKLATWHDAAQRVFLEDDYLPVPSVDWLTQDNRWHLRVTACAFGPAGRSSLLVRYLVENTGSTSSAGKLFVALRPFQVNPPWQDLGWAGGTSRIDSIRYDGRLVQVNAQKVVVPLTAPAAFGAAGFDQGDITEYLEQGRLPDAQRCVDHTGFASAGLAYALDLPPGTSAEVCVAVPFHQYDGTLQANMSAGSASQYTDLVMRQVIRGWREQLSGVGIRLPDTAQTVINTVRSNLAYIVINADGPGIQPGSRTYERSWIRDGSLTSTALLQMGFRSAVRAYIDWYAGFQYPSGKIPCVVDRRGADPVPEHDSHGEFIYVIMQYFRYVNDTTWLRGKLDHVVKAVRYIQSLRAERKTEPYRSGTPEQRACFGLLPESISHEGYSAKPMHSYWDDLFALRGLKDATAMAGVLGEKALEKEFAAERDDIARDLYASMRLVMQTKGIDYIPGCAELGDFDATSTTIGVAPVGELGRIPEPQLHRTFDKYYQYFLDRKNGRIDWVNYTPYEVRIIGTFVMLDQKQRAHEAMDFFLKDRHPRGWNQWAEVVWRTPDTPRYVGDIPHTWVGSDFIRSVRSMFVYEREPDTALVVAAGVHDGWVDDPAGIDVTALPTWYGPLTYSMRRTGDTVRVELSDGLHVPSGGVIVKAPHADRLARILVNGQSAVPRGDGKQATLRRLPARVEFVYH